jgi:hypothetical protein
MRPADKLGHHAIDTVDWDGKANASVRARRGVSAPTLFSAKSNGRDVDNQRKVERWVEALRSSIDGGSIEYGRATT